MEMEMTVRSGFVVDGRNNRASIATWGSEEQAREALASCTDCQNCLNCQHCRGCFDCEGCRECVDCAFCRNCVGGLSCADQRDVVAVCDQYGQKTPIIPNIHQAVYAAASQPDALDMGNFHRCGTTHCRAGWVIHLAGPEGYALATRTSSTFAAMQIYRASGYRISPVRFFESKAKALQDMKKLATMEREGQLSPDQ